MCSAAGLSGAVTVTSFPPPTVDGLYVSGSTWSQPFKDYLQALGGGSSRYGYWALNTRALPWVNVNQITVLFPLGTRVDAGDLTVRGVAVPEYPVVSVRVEEQRYPELEQTIATFTLARPLDTDRVTLEVNGEPPDGVNNPWRGWLDGNRDQQPGDDFVWELPVVIGGGGDEVVARSDLWYTRLPMYTSTESLGTPPMRYSAFRDINGDGRISVTDYAQVFRRLNT